MKATYKNKVTKCLKFFMSDFGKENGMSEKFNTIFKKHKGDWKKISMKLNLDSDFKPR